jgi:hypothetical protein
MILVATLRGALQVTEMDLTCLIRWCRAVAGMVFGQSTVFDVIVLAFFSRWRAHTFAPRIVSVAFIAFSTKVRYTQVLLISQS